MFKISPPHKLKRISQPLVCGAVMAINFLMGGIAPSVFQPQMKKINLAISRSIMGTEIITENYSNLIRFLIIHLSNPVDMQRICFAFGLFFCSFSQFVKGQDIVGMTHKQVLEYWQQKYPADQISDNPDLIIAGGANLCSFGKKYCEEYSKSIDSSEVAQTRIALMVNKDLRYVEKEDAWYNDIKRFVWRIIKVTDTDYQLDCKKL